MHAPYVGISFYTGSPVSIKFIHVLNIIYLIVLIFTLDDFYFHALHINTKLFFTYIPEVYTVQLTISDHQILATA